jgi:histidinol-phosphate/aromatic aminotransferase/cobyric acid decarboxylase-like protein
MQGGSSITQLMHAFGDIETNVAEGYPKFAFTRSQQAIVDRLPAFMAEANATPYSVLEARAQRALLDAVGQSTAPVGTGRILSYYAASVAIDIVGRCLAGRTKRVAVIHPTLDCLPALIRSRGVEVVPFNEARMNRRDPLEGLDGVGGLYIANPNNPTGTIEDPKRLRRLAESCARRGVALAIDACFRVFDRRAQYDHYAVLDATGVDYVIVEDSGKLWPLAGVRLSFLAFGANSRLGVPEASADLLMMAPAFGHDLAAGGMAAIHERMASNRAILAAALQGSRIARLAYPDSVVSMALIRLAPGYSSTRLWGRLIRRGVSAVPGRAIWWARGGTGEHYLRVALAREPEVLERAGREIRAELDEMARA